MRCPVLALEQGSPLAVVPVGGPSVFVPVSPSLDAVDFCSCHGTVISNLTISPHHLTSVDALASPPPPPRHPLLRASLSHGVALARSSPPGTGGYCCSADANHH